MAKIDTSNIDLDDLIEQESPTRLGKASGNGTKRTRKGQCPWCGGTDRFAVLVGDTPQHYYCGIHGGEGCHRHGDAITFLVEFRNMKFVDAVKYLGLELPPREGTSPGYTPPPKKERPMEVNLDAPPSDTWAMAALSFAGICQKILWSDQGKPAIAFLKKRGLTEATIKERGYGYNPVERFVDIAEWDVYEGKKVWLPRGIVIPWMISGTIWKISIRRGDADLKRDIAQGKKPNKYVPIKGGSNAIYRADTIRPGQPLVVFEGEFNADILGQALAEAGITNVAVVATGSTGKGRADNWLVKIAKASPLLFSFDPDGAGAKAMNEYWLQVLPHGLPWQSTGGDLNDMYLAGKDVVKWVNKGLKIAGSSLPVPLPPVPVQPPIDLTIAPATSGNLAYYHTIHEGPYDDTDGVKREYIVTYLSYHTEPDICFSPYFEQVMNEVAAFEADSTLLAFDLWDTTSNILIARFKKWRVEGDTEPPPPASFSLPKPIQEFNLPLKSVKDAAGKWDDKAIDWKALAASMPALLPDSEVPQGFKDTACIRCHHTGKVCRRCDGVIVCSCFWWWYADTTPVQPTLAA